MHDGRIVRKNSDKMNADLVRLFQLGELAVKGHARLTKVASASEGKNKGALVRVPLVRGQARELVASLDLVRPQTRGSKSIHEKNRPDHHGQHDQRYIGRYLNFIFRRGYLRAFSKAELSLNFAAARPQDSRCGYDSYGILAI